MNETARKQSFYYKIAEFEKALTILRIHVVQRDFGPLHLTPTMMATLLEAARLGAIELYKDHSILERMNYPLP